MFDSQNFDNFLFSRGIAFKKETEPRLKYFLSNAKNDKKITLYIHNLQDYPSQDYDYLKKTYRAAHMKLFQEGELANIRVMQYFSDEVLNKSEIVQSMILNRLGLLSSISGISARKCEVKEISATLAKDFYNSSHIDGFTKSKIHFGLIFQGQILSCLSFRMPVQKKHGVNIIEISRLASKPFFVVPGGFSKLLKVAKFWAKDQSYTGILTYSDLRFGFGDVYKNNGFVPVGRSSNNYWYTDGLVRHFRFKFRAQPGKTEKEVALTAGVKPIFGAGHNIYKMSLDTPAQV